MHVQIRHSGNLLEIAPVEVEQLLSKTLTYWYKAMENDPRAKDVGKMKFTAKRVYAIREGKLLCLHGVLTRVMTTLKEAGCTVDYQDLRERRPLVADQANMHLYLPDSGLRIGQDEIIRLICEKDMGQFEAPTGFGKTEIIALVVAMFPRAKIIVCSPSTSLLRDTYPRLLKITPYVTRIGGGYTDQPGRIVLTTDRSLTRIPIDSYDMLFFDEVHRAASPETSKVLAQIRHTRMYGFSATTCKRGDGADLRTEALFGPVIFTMSYQEAEELKYVSPVRYHMTHITPAECDINCKSWDIPAMRKMYGYWLNDVRSFKLMQAAIQVPAELGIMNPQIMVAVETLTHAYRLKSIDPSFTVVYADKDMSDWNELKRKGIVPRNEELLDRKTREYLRQQFSSGALRRVICTPTWSTGMNFVHLDEIVNASGATSAILTIQWAGRGSRVRSNKPFALIIDSGDEWDSWAKDRASARDRIYRSKGWAPALADTRSSYQQEMVL